MINYIKGDFWRVKEASEEVLGRHIPLWVFTPYYIIVGLLALPILPIVWLVYTIKFKRMMKIIYEDWD